MVIKGGIRLAGDLINEGWVRMSRFFKIKIKL